MNKFWVGVLATLGAVDVVMSIITPIMVALLTINLLGLKTFGVTILIIIGLLSSLFRGIKVGFPDVLR